MDMNLQYRTIEAGAGYADRRHRGRIRLEGPDSLVFLQALLTNDVAGLSPGTGRYAAYLTPQGRMIADLDVFSRPDAVICGVAPGLAPSLTARLDALIFAEQTRVSDVSATLGELLVVGAKAAAVVAAAVGATPEALEALLELEQLAIPSGFVARSGDSLLPSFRLFVAADEAPGLIARLEAAGVIPMSDVLVDALRIACGRAAWGADLSEHTIPLEAGLLDRAISTSKGCYVGQEVIIRILHRGGGRVAKRLVRLDAAGATGPLPPVGAALATADGADAGQLTSVAPALGGDGWSALGYLARDHAEVGREFVVRDSGARAVVAALAS